MKTIAFASVIGAALLLSACDKKTTAPSGVPQAIETPQADASSIAEDISAGNYQIAASNAQKALGVEPHNAELYLLLARSEARLQNAGEAVGALQKSVSEGLHDPRGALNHPDFDGIRTTEAFTNLAARYVEGRSSGSQENTIQAGDASISEDGHGHSHIHAGDIDLKN